MNEGRYKGPARIELKGDQEKAQGFIGLARTQMGRMLERMRLSDLKQLVWRRDYQGVFIETFAALPGIFSIRIGVPVVGFVKNCVALVQSMLGGRYPAWTQHHPPSPAEIQPKMLGHNAPSNNKDPIVISDSSIKNTPHVLITHPKEGRSVSTDGLYSLAGDADKCFDIGNPWHGLCRGGRLHNYTGPAYFSQGSRLYYGNNPATVFHQRNPVLSYTGMRKIQALVDFDQQNNHHYVDYILLTGDNRTVAQKPLGAGSWIYFDALGNPWGMQFGLEYNEGLVRATVLLKSTIGRFTLQEGNIDQPIGELLFDRTFTLDEIATLGGSMYFDTSLKQSSHSLSGRKAALNIYRLGNTIGFEPEGLELVDLVSVLVFEISGTGSLNPETLGEGIQVDLVEEHYEEDLEVEIIDATLNDPPFASWDADSCDYPGLGFQLSPEDITCLGEEEMVAWHGGVVGTCCLERREVRRDRTSSTRSSTRGLFKTVTGKVKAYFLNEDMHWVSLQFRQEGSGPNWYFHNYQTYEVDREFTRTIIRYVCCQGSFPTCTLVSVTDSPIIGTWSHNKITIQASYREGTLNYSDGRSFTGGAGFRTVVTCNNGSSSTSNVNYSNASPRPYFVSSTAIAIKGRIVSQYGGDAPLLYPPQGYNPATDTWGEEGGDTWT